MRKFVRRLIRSGEVGNSWRVRLVWIGCVIFLEVYKHWERLGCTCVRSGEVDEARIGWFKTADVRSG